MLFLFLFPITFRSIRQRRNKIKAGLHSIDEINELF